MRRLLKFIPFIGVLYCPDYDDIYTVMGYILYQSVSCCFCILGLGLILVWLF